MRYVLDGGLPVLLDTPPHLRTEEARLRSEATHARLALRRVTWWPSWSHMAFGPHNPFLCDTCIDSQSKREENRRRQDQAEMAAAEMRYEAYREGWVACADLWNQEVFERQRSTK